MNIQSKIILISAAIFFLAISTNTWFNGLYFTSEYSKALKAEVFVIAQTLKSQLDRLLKMHIPIDQLEGFEEMCQEVITEHDFISFAMVLSPDGTILFHNDPTQHGKSISNISNLDQIKDKGRTVQESLLNNKNYYDFFIPVLGAQNEHIATIRIGFPINIVSVKTKKLALYSTGITVLSSFIGILLLIVVLNLWVGKPIFQFTNTIREIRENWAGSAKKVEITSNDEIGQLALAFNQMTDELRQTTVSKDYMDNIIGNMLNSLIVIDTGRTILSVNQATLDLLGFEEAGLIGKPIDLVLSDPNRLDTAPPKNKKRMKPLRGAEVSYLSKNGREIPVLFSSSTMLNKKQEIIGFICVAQDITKRKLAEKEKINAQKIADEHKKMALVGQVAGKMAHDFNNILAAIMGVSELALMDCKDDEMNKSLDIIFKQTIRGKNLTKNLVAFAKSQEPKQKFFNINEKINSLLNLMKRDLRGIFVKVDVEHDLPDLLADAGMIEHSIVNLIQNSIHAVSKTKDAKIIIRTYHFNENIIFEIEDNGCGIPKESLEKIYDPSFTLKGSKDATSAYQTGIKGTGYGMSNVKKYIDQHNGGILVESVVNSGTKVTINLPVIKKGLSEEEKVAVQRNPIDSGKNILLMEDEKAISDVQLRILTQDPCNHKVDVADNGQAAIDLFNRNDYDFISLDYVLPGNLNGMDVYKHIREENKIIPILFISGNIEFLESIKNLKLQDPYVSHLSKPSSNIEYINCINVLMHKANT